MNNNERIQWESSRVKYWLDTIFNSVLVFCVCLLAAMLAGVDLEQLMGVVK